MAEREITITLKAKNLTQGQFDAAREELKKLGIEADGMTNRGKRLGDSMQNANSIAGVFNTQMTRLASAFAIGAIVDRAVSSIASFASAALESAGNLVDLRNATGVSLGRLQEWNHVAEQGGIQLENFTKSAFDLGAKLSGGDGLRGAVERLGLSWTNLKSLKPEEQLDQVLRAAEKLGPSTERNSILVELFGNKGALSLAKIVDGYAETAGAATKAGDAQIEALDRAGDAWAKFKKDIGTGFVQVMGTAITSMQELERGADSMSTKDKAWLFLTKGATTYADTLRETGRQLIATEQAEQKRASAAVAGAGASASAQRDYRQELSLVAKEAANVDASTKAQILAASALGVKTDELTNRFGVSEQAIKKLVEQQRASEAATKKLGEAQAEIDPTIQRLTASFQKQIEAHQKLAQTSSAPAFFEGFRLARVELADGAPLVSGTTVEWEKLRAEQQRVATEMGSFLAPTVKRVGVAVKESNTEVDAADTAWGKAAQRLSIVSGILDHIPGKFAEIASVASRAGTAIADSLSKGDTLGAVVAGVTGVVTVIGKLFTDRNKAEVQKYNQEIGKLRDGLLQTHGTLDELEAAGQRVGISFRENWGHQGQKGLEQMNALIKQFDERTKAVGEALGRVGSGFSAVVTGMTKPWVELGVAIDAAYKKTGETEAAYKRALADPKVAADQLLELQRAFYDASEAEQVFYRERAGLQRAHKQELADLGVQAIASFGAAMVAGKSYSESLASIGPSLATLGQSYKALGLDVEDVGLKHLILQSTVATGNPQLIAAASGLGASMQGLAQLGMLNAESFAAMQRTGTAMYQRLQGEVGNLGGDTRDALIPMQGYLQEAALQARLLGIPLDANTQMLIDQSNQLGIWQEKGQTAQEVLIEGMGKLVEKVSALIDQFLGVTNAINTIPATRTVTIEAVYVDNGPPDGWGQGGGNDSAGYASGTFGVHGFDFPDFGEGTRTVLHHREAVVPYEKRIETAQRWLGQDGGSSAAVAPPNVIIYVDPSTGNARQMSESEFDQIQARLYEGGLQVPARAITQRTR